MRLLYRLIPAVLWLLLIAATPGTPGTDRVARSLPDTTIVDSVRAGGILIRALPEQVRGMPVLSYEPTRMPAVGWFVDRSFFWQTAPETPPGNYRFEFRARIQEGMETVTFRVVVVAND